MATKRKHNPDAAKARENARKRAEEEQRRARNAKLKAHWPQLTIMAVVLIAVIVGVFILADFLSAPGGSLREFHGKLYGTSENPLIYKDETQGDARYYEVGSVTDPEGFARDPSYYSVTKDEKKPQYYYLADDKTGPIHSVYFATVDKTAAEMADTIANSGYYLNTETKEFTVNGVTFTCVYGTSEDTPEDQTQEPTTGSCLAAAYTDAGKGGSVLVMVQTNTQIPLGEIPEAETMFAQAEAMAHYVKVNQ